MLKIPFVKMNGLGNDFIIIDNRKQILNRMEINHFTKNVCKRRTSIGADGLMLVENSHVCDFKMKYFNSDGSVGEMCGNGARCISRFAYEKNIAPSKMSFETLGGTIEAEVSGKNVRIKMEDITFKKIKRNDKIKKYGKDYNYSLI